MADIVIGSKWHERRPRDIDHSGSVWSTVIHNVIRMHAVDYEPIRIVHPSAAAIDAARHTLDASVGLRPTRLPPEQD